MLMPNTEGFCFLKELSQLSGVCARLAHTKKGPILQAKSNIPISGTSQAFVGRLERLISLAALAGTLMVIPQVMHRACNKIRDKTFRGQLGRQEDVRDDVWTRRSFW
jgi:hypothetical protein